MMSLRKCSMNTSQRRPGSGWRTILLASVVLCAGFAMPSRGGPSGGSGETVGTLPGTGGGGLGMNISRVCRDSKPALYLEGPIEEIYATVVGLTGRAAITQESLGVSTQSVRLTFHGDIRLELDRLLFEQGSIQVGWTVPQAFGPARVSMLLGDRTIASGLVTARSVALPILAMHSFGGLETTPLSIVANGRHRMHSQLEVAISGDLLTLSQLH